MGLLWSKAIILFRLTFSFNSKCNVIVACSCLGYGAVHRSTIVAGAARSHRTCNQSSTKHSTCNCQTHIFLCLCNLEMTKMLDQLLLILWSGFKNILQYLNKTILYSWVGHKIAMFGEYVVAKPAYGAVTNDVNQNIKESFLSIPALPFLVGVICDTPQSGSSSREAHSYPDGKSPYGFYRNTEVTGSHTLLFIYFITFVRSESCRFGYLNC